MCEEIEDINDNYYNIKGDFLKNPENIEQNIKCWIGTNCDSESGSQLEIVEVLKGIVISIYIVCKEMKYDLEIEDLFKILSSKCGYDVATNIIEDILNYK